MLREMAQETGVLPPALADRPELSPFLVWVVGHFNIVANDRSYGAELPMKLSTEQVEAYRVIYEVDCLRLDFHRYIRMADDAWYEQMLEKRRKSMAT